MTPEQEATPARLEALAWCLPIRRKRRPPPSGPPRRLRAVVAYDGTRYSGWQRQRDHVGVQEILEVGLELATGTRCPVFGSGRTDAGVHAEGQVFIADTTSALPPSGIEALLLQILPADVRVRDVRDAAADWNPQKAARDKLYRYTILGSDHPSPARERSAWRIPAPLDVEAMREAAALLVGTHDFRTFRTDPGPERRGEDTVRTVRSIEVSRALDTLRVDVRGPGFLYKMVRNLTAALVAVGRGDREPAWAGEVLRACDRRLLPPPAPAEGLCLVSVTYPEEPSAG